MKFKIEKRYSSDILKEGEAESFKEFVEKNKDDLRGSDLCGSDLSDSDLHGSNLSDSDLSDSDLRDSDLSDSDLSDSDLSGSNLRDSDLSGAFFYRTKIKKSQIDEFLVAIGIIVKD